MYQMYVEVKKVRTEAGEAYFDGPSAVDIIDKILRLLIRGKSRRFRFSL